MDDPAKALFEVGRELQAMNYRFITVTPATHARVQENARRRGQELARSLRDVFGWNRPFSRDLLPEPMLAALQAAQALVTDGPHLRSTVRFSTLGSHLFAHSAFPTLDADAVFFGPDTYRFADVLERWMPPARRVIDVGCGSGAGGISVGHRATNVVLADINPRALRLAAVNAALAGVSSTCLHSDVLDRIDGDFDVVIANAPYLRDASKRAYRDGGGRYGEALSLRIVDEALSRLGPRGTLILYTGATIADGIDTFRAALDPLVADRCVEVEYRELEPDVFGEELDSPLYADAERIAAVALRAVVG